MERERLEALLAGRLAAAGMDLPAEVTGELARALELHLERLRVLADAATLGPADLPYTDPTRAVG
jgi:hypothetical protein